MQLMITAQTPNTITISNGRQTVEVARLRHAIAVCNRNASNRAWNNGRLGGRHFVTEEEALSAYKSAFMNAAIKLAFAKI
jgi:hypothetical protein